MLDRDDLSARPLALGRGLVVQGFRVDPVIELLACEPLERARGASECSMFHRGGLC